MSKFLLASEHHGSLYVYDYYNVDETCSLSCLAARELKFSEPSEKSSGGLYSKHWVLDGDHLLVEWDATGYEEGDETPCESKTFNATIFSLVTYKPLGTCMLGFSNAKIVGCKTYINTRGEKFLYLFVTDEWGPQRTIKIWNWSLLSSSPISANSYEEWLAMTGDKDAKIFFEAKMEILENTFRLSTNSPVTFCETFCYDQNAGREMRNGWEFWCTKKKKKYSNKDIPGSSKYYPYIKHRLLNNHTFSLLVNDTSVSGGEWNYQIISFPCDCELVCKSDKVKDEQLMILYKKDLHHPETEGSKISGVINFLVLTENQLVVSTSKNLFITDLYLNIQQQVRQPLLPEFLSDYPHLMSRIELAVLLPSTHDAEKLKLKLNLFLGKVLSSLIPSVLISLVADYLFHESSENCCYS